MMSDRKVANGPRVIESSNYSDSILIRLKMTWV